MCNNAIKTDTKRQSQMSNRYAKEHEHDYMHHVKSLCKNHNDNATVTDHQMVFIPAAAILDQCRELEDNPTAETIPECIGEVELNTGEIAQIKLSLETEPERKTYHGRYSHMIEWYYGK